MRRLRLFAHCIFIIYLCSCVGSICLLTVFSSSVFVRVSVAFVFSLYFPHLSLFVCRLRLFAHCIFLIYLCSWVGCVCLLTVFSSSIFVRVSIVFVCSLYFPHLSLFVGRLRLFAHCIFLIYLCSCVDCVCLLTDFPHLSLFVCRLRLFAHCIFLIYLCSWVGCVCLLTVFSSSIFVRVSIVFVC